MLNLQKSSTWILTRFFVTTIFASFFIMARAPDVVEEKIVITEADAEAAIELLGLAKNKSFRYELLLGSDFQLPKKTDKTNAQMKAAHNDFRYEPKTKKSKAKLEIRSHWLDAETGSLMPVPKYLFSSPFIPKEELSKSSWGPIFKSLKVSEKDASKSSKESFVTIIDRSTGTHSKNFFTVKIQTYWHFRNPAKADWGKGSEADRTLVPGFIVQIGVDTRGAKEREKIDAKHKKWLKENEGLD